MLVLLLLSYVACQAKLAPLEFPTNRIMLGAWWDRLNGQSPSAINKKINYKPLTIWHSDVNITSVFQDDFFDNIISEIAATETNAAVYVTVYPMDGFAQVTDAALGDFVERVKKVTSQGGKLFIRYAPEMNGSWFIYGQLPRDFIVSWKRVVKAIRDACGADNVAFIWAPNSVYGYPFKLSTYSQDFGSKTFQRELDTNSDGKFDVNDDPYTPFYPGDEWVDWVGMSLYHYGPQFPWVDNAVPVLGKAETFLIGTAGGQVSSYNFYRMFSGDGVGGSPGPASKGGKPFMITETAATVHTLVVTTDGTPPVVPPGQSPAERAAIKQAWWRQIINSTFLQTYPRIKAVNFFEFYKFEETSFRDFTVFGGDGDLGSSLNPDDGSAQDGLTLAAFQEDMRGDLGKLVLWGGSGPLGQISGSPDVVIGSNNETVTPPKNNGVLRMVPAALLDFIALLLLL